MKITEKLQHILDKSVDQKRSFGTSFAIHTDGLEWSGASGNLSVNTQYFIASTTKLFVTAIMLQLRKEGKVEFTDPLGKFLESDIVAGLNIFKGNDYSATITVGHLLAHTSGIPDYFQKKDKNGMSLEKQILEVGDKGWSFEDAVQRSKSLSPLFIPGSPGKAHYSDTNFQLLGKIIENITGKTFVAACRERIAEPLALANTYVYEDTTDERPALLYYKQKQVVIPKAMVSFGADGAIVSTSADMMTFLKAFFGGLLFPTEYLSPLKVWNNIFFPMQSGIGIHRFKLMWIMNPFGTVPELIGHSGLSGALAFYAPSRNLFITGTVNQIAYPDTSFKLAIKLILSMK